MYLSVHVASQKMVLHRDEAEDVIYPISTSSKGTGQQEGSWKTPLGLHEIRSKIGHGLPLHSVFVGRRFTGEVYTPEVRKQYPGRKDWILTRILWLRGLERGYNRFGNVDTMRRYIYIHGSPDTAVMGQPGSRGCIRMHGKRPN